MCQSLTAVKRQNLVAETLADNDRRRTLLKCTTWVKVDARLTYTSHVYTRPSLADPILPYTCTKRARTVRERPWIALGVGLHWEVVEFPPTPANLWRKGKKRGAKFSAPKPPTNFLLTRVYNLWPIICWFANTKKFSRYTEQQLRCASFSFLTYEVKTYRKNIYILSSDEILIFFLK